MDLHCGQLDHQVRGRTKDFAYEVEIKNGNRLLRRIEQAFMKKEEETRLGTTTTNMRKHARLCIRNGGLQYNRVRPGILRRNVSDMKYLYTLIQFSPRHVLTLALSHPFNQ
ncbi:hypothetical protein EVAR_81688_1 [Eumeta japonica]|uniref:Uncharacterized protein n=1 Tax=Eumeta variegata TaxID=151549 RepID=A0A4C1V3P0_EUMVA|nr:hypothetical protein EVAR_81688_1 [Eumeta japonica]